MPIKKKTTKKVVTKKVPAKKAVTKKAPAKKASVKKAPVKKKAPAKKVAKKVVKKTAAKKLTMTRIIARVDVGFGNQLYIRGENGGLDWEHGILMENISPYEWSFTTHYPAKQIEFKFLINDELWSEGNNLKIAAGKESISSPTFAW
ncbi:MAG: hypothetical protein ACPGH0_00250 [Opitutales bacterium]